MTPEGRFHSTIVALVVPIMYFSIKAILPYIPASGAPATIGQSAIALLASLGVYKLLTQIFIVLVRRVRLVKKWVLGPRYLEGTWVGYFLDDAEQPVYIVETMEQDLSSLVLKGASYTADGTMHARWASNSATVDPVEATLTYSYTCDVITKGVPHQGIGVFDLRRPLGGDSAEELEGYSADLTNGKRSPSHERKISDVGLKKLEALPEAIRFTQLHRYDHIGAGQGTQDASHQSRALA